MGKEKGERKEKSEREESERELWMFMHALQPDTYKKRRSRLIYF